MGRTRKTPHPLATLEQPLRLGNPAAAGVPRTFVFCAEGKDEGWTVVHTATRLKANDKWEYGEIAADHLAPITAPGEVAAALLSLV